MATPSSAASRLVAYLDQLGTAVGHADRREPLRAYVTDCQGGPKCPLTTTVGMPDARAEARCAAASAS